MHRGVAGHSTFQAVPPLSCRMSRLDLIPGAFQRRPSWRLPRSVAPPTRRNVKVALVSLFSTVTQADALRSTVLVAGDVEV